MRIGSWTSRANAAVAVMCILGVCLLAGAAASAGAHAKRGGDCTDHGTKLKRVDGISLPCRANAGETYGTYTLPDGNDSEPSLEAILRSVLGEKTRVTPVATDLTASSGDFTLDLPTPEEAPSATSFGWSYAGKAPLAFMTVASQDGTFVTYDIAKQTHGTTNIDGLIGSYDRVTHISFWQRTYSDCEGAKAKELHGKGLEQNIQLAQIKKGPKDAKTGKVLTVGVDSGKVRMSDFREVRKPSTPHAPAKPRSGKWVETTRGDYAAAGQAITRKGKPGGRWVIGSKEQEDAGVPCLKAKHHKGKRRDSAGSFTPAGSDLAGAGVQETPGAATNVSGRPLSNYATREVCTNSPTHPDHAGQSSRPSANVWCFIGSGAGLNDRYGTERMSPAAGGIYYTQTTYTHRVVFNNTVVPAAKRPATKPNGDVLTNTPIVWRPVASNSRIAN